MKQKESTLRWMIRVPGRKNLYIVLLTLVQAVTGCFGVAHALLLRNIVDCAAGRDAAGFRRHVLLIVGLVAVQLAAAALLRRLNELARCDLENCFKERLFGNILRRDYGAVSAVHTAEWLNRLTNDTVVAANGSVEILPGLAGTAVRLVSALVMIIVLDAWFAAILIPGGIALVILTYTFRKVLKRLHKNIQESDGDLRVFLQERIGSLMVLKAFAAEDASAEEARRKMAGHKAARMRRNTFSNVCNIGFGAAMQGMYLLGVVYCAHGILTGRVTYGTLTAVMQLIGQVQAPFANISGYLPRFYAVTASAERLMEAEEFAKEAEAKSEEEVRRFYRDEFRSLGLKNVTFSYPDKADQPVLSDFCLEVKKGGTVAFTGQSGCGKSTVLKLLMCMYTPDRGSRTLNDGELTAAWRRLFAYVPQGNVLMSGTIREVVSFAKPSESGNDEKLREALRLACADGFTEDLDAVLGERGTGLSEGQMQRIAVARALFSDAPVLLLDEATSALDEQTEHGLLKNLKELTDRTVIIITHRRAALSICDRVIGFTERGASETEGGEKEETREEQR